MSNPLVKLMDVRDADKSRDIPEYQKWWYVTIRTLLAKDPTLALQLDVGPEPGHLVNLDLAVKRLQYLFAVHVGIPDERVKYRGLTGYFAPGIVRDRAACFASVLVTTKDNREQDTILLSEAYEQMSAYMMDTMSIRGVKVMCLPDSMHSDALNEAGFTEAARIVKGARGLRRTWSDFLIFTKG